MTTTNDTATDTPEAYDQSEDTPITLSIKATKPRGHHDVQLTFTLATAAILAALGIDPDQILDPASDNLRLPLANTDGTCATLLRSDEGWTKYTDGNYHLGAYLPQRTLWTRGPGEYSLSLPPLSDLLAQIAQAAYDQAHLVINTAAYDTELKWTTAFAFDHRRMAADARATHQRTRHAKALAISLDTEPTPTSDPTPH